MGLSERLQAREELGWYFAGVGPAVGLRAAGLEGSGGAIYDEAASARDHMRRFDPTFRAQLRRLRVVQTSLARLASEHVKRLELAFTPFGASRASWRLLTAMARDGVCLVPVALQTRSLLAMWAAATKESEAPPPFLLLLFLEDQVAGLKRGNRIPVSHRLHRVLDEAAEAVDSSLGSYEGVRTVVALEEARKRQEARAAAMAQVNARLRGEDARKAV